MSLEAAPSAPQNVPPGQMPPEVPQPHFAQLHPHFQHHKFLIRRKFFKIFGAEANVFSESGELLLKCKQKAFKLKEDLTVYGDEALSQPLLRMRARQVFDIGVTFDIFDVSTGPEVKIGALRRMGMKSIARDEWQIWDLNDQPIGIIQEDSLLTALLRRFVDFVSLFVPQPAVQLHDQRPSGGVHEAEFQSVPHEADGGFFARHARLAGPAAGGGGGDAAVPDRGQAGVGWLRA
ncbi:MAG: hypothetical protein RLY93_00230 [Sumerlaeia bacterium]